jgi:hypothetical protein
LLWLRLLSIFDVILIFNDVLLRALLNCTVSVHALDMKPCGPLKPPQVLVESVLVEWRTTVDTNPVPVHPQVDPPVMRFSPVLLTVPLLALIAAPKS